MHYFEAKKAESLFREYKRLALDYRDSEEKRDADRMKRAREQLNIMLYSANTFATQLNAGVSAQQMPPLGFGGAVIPVNFLSAVVEPDQGYTGISETQALDAIDRCIGAAQYHQRRALKRMRNPLCWLVDLPAAVARWPFQVMRKAGVSASVEDHVVSQAIKIIIVVAMYALATYFGVKLKFQDILRLWK
jgi:hypothetical protein